MPHETDLCPREALQHFIRPDCIQRRHLLK
jgi:hypothetical protein